MRGGLWRRRVCQPASRARCGALCGGGGGLRREEEVVALRGGLWREEEVAALRGGLWRRLLCQSASRARCGAVCGGGGGLWREEVAVARSCAAGRSVAAACLPISKSRSLRGGLWRRRFCQPASRARARYFMHHARRNLGQRRHQLPEIAEKGEGERQWGTLPPHPRRYRAATKALPLRHGCITEGDRATGNIHAAGHAVQWLPEAANSRRRYLLPEARSARSCAPRESHVPASKKKN